MKAIISDIHSNLEALQAVLDDIASQNVQEIYCLGDVVGYGPNPRECVDQVMKWFDDRGLSYLGWTWNTWDCSAGPSLISDYAGTPTAYGIGLRDHLRALNG